MQCPHDCSGNRKRSEASRPQATFPVSGSKAWKMPEEALSGALHSCRIGPARRPPDWTLTASVDATWSKAMVQLRRAAAPAGRWARRGRLRCGTGAERTKPGCPAPQALWQPLADPVCAGVCASGGYSKGRTKGRPSHHAYSRILGRTVAQPKLPITRPNVIKGRSQNRREPNSKTGGRGFESLPPCYISPGHKGVPRDRCHFFFGRVQPKRH